MTTVDLMSNVRSIMQIIFDLESTSELLGWDQETYMPDGAVMARADQMSTLELLAHQKITSEAAKTLAENVRDNFDKFTVEDQKLLRLFLRDFDKAAKLPSELVAELAYTKALAHESWKKARKEQNFKIFSGHLNKLINLLIEEAERYGYEDNRYDALLDLYEPGLTVNWLEPVFDELKYKTIELYNQHKDKKIDAEEIFIGKFNHDNQMLLAAEIAHKMGFDFLHGRIDTSIHPFTASFSANDVRITVRTDESDLTEMLFGLIHETGHALYEQGINPRYYRSFAMRGASMGIHESQSLIWENNIARSREFWKWALPVIKKYFGLIPYEATPEDAFKLVNRLRPSTIRLKSDELTYNLHIILRFELEEALINGKIKTDDIPIVWNEKTREYLGLTPKNDTEGCLQDIHWSMGAFGYFPSYTLGKLYAASFEKALKNDITETSENIIHGKFSPIRNWLLENIHTHGQSKLPSEILSEITGSNLTAKDFVSYISDKLSKVYNF